MQGKHKYESQLDLFRITLKLLVSEEAYPQKPFVTEGTEVEKILAQLSLLSQRHCH